MEDENQNYNDYEPQPHAQYPEMPPPPQEPQSPVAQVNPDDGPDDQNQDTQGEKLQPNQSNRGQRQGGQTAAGKAAGRVRDAVTDKALAAAQKAGGPVAAAATAAQALRAVWDENARKKLKEDAKKWIIWACVILGILLFIVVLFINIFFGLGGGAAQQQSNNQPNTPQNPLTINKTGPDKVANGSEIQYTVTVGFPHSVQDIIIVDTLDKRTRFVDSTWKKFTLGGDAGGNPTVTWKLSENYTPTASSSGNIISGPIATTFTFRVQPVVTDNYVYNLGITAQTVGAIVGGGASFNYIPPVASDCSGTYAPDFAKFRQYGFQAKNYGDPNCELIDTATRKDKVYSLILSTEQAQIANSTDPKVKNNPNLSKEYATIWFVTIIPGESGFDPDDWAPPTGSQLVLDSGGAWGLTQMGSSNPAGQAPDINVPSSWGKNDGAFHDGFVVDRGDVNWQMQIYNSVIYNHNRLKCDFSYWGTYNRSGVHATPC